MGSKASAAPAAFSNVIDRAKSTITPFITGATSSAPTQSPGMTTPGGSSSSKSSLLQPAVMPTQIPSTSGTTPPGGIAAASAAQPTDTYKPGSPQPAITNQHDPWNASTAIPYGGLSSLVQPANAPNASGIAAATTNALPAQPVGGIASVAQPPATQAAPSQQYGLNTAWNNAHNQGQPQSKYGNRNLPQMGWEQNTPNRARFNKWNTLRSSNNGR